MPGFEWAAYGVNPTGRMYGMTAAVNSDYIFAAGFLKSTLDPEAADFVDISNDYAITGPYTSADWDGSSAKTVTVDLKSYPTGGGASENAGGSWRAYEAGLVKIDKTTGEPVRLAGLKTPKTPTSHPCPTVCQVDVYVYYGEGMDETTGLAASGDMLAISGHFSGNLSAKLADGTVATILNSNTAPGELPDPADQFHAAGGGSQHTGVDDGFVIKASATTGQAEWITHYPQTNRDAQVVGVDMDAAGNVFGSGYACSLAADATEKVCNGFVAKFAAADGSLEWEQTFTDLGGAFWIKYDASDESLYFTATTTYGGLTTSRSKGAPDGKVHTRCDHASCAVTGRLSATDGTVHWLRTFQGSPRWGAFDQSGDIELAADGDGPYVYAAFDDAGENGAVTLDAGTPYAGCKAADGTVTPEYDISTSKLVTAADCPAGSTFVARTDADAVPAAAAKTYTLCGNKDAGMACIVKYHKFTGMPVWSRDSPMVAAMVPAPDGKSLMITGWSYASWGEARQPAVCSPQPSSPRPHPCALYPTLSLPQPSLSPPPPFSPPPSPPCPSPPPPSPLPPPHIRPLLRRPPRHHLPRRPPARRLRLCLCSLRRPLRLHLLFRRPCPHAPSRCPHAPSRCPHAPSLRHPPRRPRYHPTLALAPSRSQPHPSSRPPPPPPPPPPSRSPSPQPSFLSPQSSALSPSP